MIDYSGAEPDRNPNISWQTASKDRIAMKLRMLAAGFVQVASFNPYWDVHGQTFEDVDGYRVVLQNAVWSY